MQEKDGLGIVAVKDEEPVPKLSALCGLTIQIQIQSI
jgi:hypothetical protein